MTETPCPHCGHHIPAEEVPNEVMLEFREVLEQIQCDLNEATASLDLLEENHFENAEKLGLSKETMNLLTDLGSKVDEADAICGELFGKEHIGS